MKRLAKRGGFTLVELLVVVGLIALLIAILLPSLAAAREAAKSSVCGQYMRTFASGFQIYANQDKKGSMSSSAFDYLRDGDIRKFGWVNDLIQLKIAVPGNMLCPANQWQINEKVVDYTCPSAIGGTGSPNPFRWGPLTTDVNPPRPIIDAAIDAASAAAAQELWNKGYNTNFATTWQFSRGDPLPDSTGGTVYDLKDAYGNNNGPDPSKCPLDGDGPLADFHLSGSSVGADRIAVMGDSRAGDGAEATLTQAMADKINLYAGRQIVKAGEFTVESFTDGFGASALAGPWVEYTTVLGAASTRPGHEFNDIVPLHKAKDKGVVGGYSNMLFADGHTARVSDTGGSLQYYGDGVTAVADVPDGFLGPYKSTTGNPFQINTTGFDEIDGVMWYGRLRPLTSPGGGSSE
ncbi:MAG: hypothetical protein HJJLKODD_02363 [Phycisphaerae bacterium]|nr:hypothetical protein [Phycisphaerae bacterium]